MKVGTVGIKDTLRRELLEARGRLSAEEVAERSKVIEEYLLNLESFKGARKLALYAPFRNEVLTERLFSEARSRGKEVFYPRVERTVEKGRHLEFHRVDERGELEEGSYEIHEPLNGTSPVHPEEFDLIVVPGVAFDRWGSRLGYGKGYYDRVLKSVRCSIIGLGYDLQLLTERLPREAHDVPVTGVITESGVHIPE